MYKQTASGGDGRRAWRWRRRLACERAIALPTAVMMLMIILLLAAAAGTAAVGASHQANRDGGEKRAVSAADAGLNTALYRLNKLKPSNLSCVVNGPLYLLLDPVLGTGWCPTVTSQTAGSSTSSEALGDGSNYSYVMSAGENKVVGGQYVQERKIISTGTANGVQRRVMTKVTSLTGVSLFGGNALTSLKDISLPVGTTITGGVATNGNVNVSMCPQIVGNSWYGSQNKQFTINGNPGNCPLFAEQRLPQDLVLNPVNVPTSNDNNRITAGTDPWVLKLLSGSNWDPANRVLQVRGASVLTLTGNTYVFCKLEVENLAQLVMGLRLGGTPLKIFIDSPENCPGVSNAGTIRVRNTASINNLNADAKTFQVYAAGSPSTATSIRFENTISNIIGVFYAPRSTVLLQNANAILGAIAADTITLEGTSRINWLDSADITTDDLHPLFKRTKWTECTSKPTGTAPDAGC
jgi:type II secretory pathway pseudopilin PulG